MYARVKITCIIYSQAGWPSGLRRQTQGSVLAYSVGLRVFWSTNVGVGSNPTSDNSFSTFILFL